MNIMKRSLQTFAGITIIYLVTSFVLVFWPSLEPFHGTIVTEGESEARELIEGRNNFVESASQDFAISTRDGEVLFARRYGPSADQLEACLAETRVDWTYLSPAAQFARIRFTAAY